MDAMVKSDYDGDEPSSENGMMKAHRAKTAKANSAYDNKEKSNTLSNPVNPGDKSWGGPQGTLLDQTSKGKVGKGKQNTLAVELQKGLGVKG